MANFDGLLDIGISDQSGSGSRYQGNRSTNVSGGVALPSTVWRGLLVPRSSNGLGTLGGVSPSTHTPVNFDCFLDPGNIAQYWFEHVWTAPKRIDLGNIVTTVTQLIEIYNAYREADRSLNTATINAGTGINFLGLPSLPDSISEQHSSLFYVQVLTSGPPSIDGTLDFELDLSLSLSIPITGTRVVMFPFQPEQPITETLEFGTDVIVSADGKEQRISYRKNPRQSFLFEVKVDEEESPRERQRLQILLSGFHAGVFGVPVWFEARYLGADAAVDDTTITVDTAYGDFRAGSLAIVWKDSETFSALEIDSLTSTSITFTSGLTFDFVAGQSLVMPLRVAITEREIRDARSLVNLDTIGIQFLVLDNDLSIADTSAFPTHNSKVLLDEANLIESGEISDDWEREVDRLDNLIGSPIQISDWIASARNTRKGFLCHGMERIWQVRQLIHALRGNQISFYLPTFFKDLTPVENLASGSVLLDIDNIGYTDFINAQEPNKSIWIQLTDGTVLTREVVSSVEVDSDTERLTVDSAWPSTISVSEVSRISFLRLSRIADPVVRFRHNYGGDAVVSIAVRGVQR